MTLTEEEIEMIEREAAELYPMPDERMKNLSGYKMAVREVMTERSCYSKAATKYLLQLKEERERAGKLLEALVEVQAGSLTGQLTRPDMNKVASKAINEYNKP